MKKITLAAIALLIAVITFAQTSVTSYKNQLGKINSYTHKTTWEPIQYSTITFTFYSTVITASDIQHSVYRLLDEGTVTYEAEWKQTMWSAIDEKDRRCKVALIKLYDSDSYTFNVFYSDRIFLYYF